MRIPLIISVLLGTVMVTGAAHGQQILIRGAKVHTADDRGTLERTDVLVRDGRIAAMGTSLAAPDGARIVDAGNRPLTPGLFAGLTGLGVTEVSAVQSTGDAALGLGAPAWRQRWRPEFDITRAFNPRSTLLPVARIEGLTWTVLEPGSGDSIVDGQGAAVTLDGRFEAVLQGSHSLFIDLGAGASGRSGGSRAAQYMLLEQAADEVRGTAPAGDKALLLPAGRKVLQTYLAGGRVVFSVQRAADIRQALAFAQRHGLQAVISGGDEAWVVADELSRAKAAVILDPLSNLPGGFDILGARLDNAALLHKAGVRIAFSTGDAHIARKIRQLAGNAVAHGLPWDAALAAVTSSPAEIFGLGGSRGRIAVGQAADLVLWSGDPLDVTSAADAVWIAGRPVRMQSRQTILRDRYFERLQQELIGTP